MPNNPPSHLVARVLLQFTITYAYTAHMEDMVEESVLQWVEESVLQWVEKSEHYIAITVISIGIAGLMTKVKLAVSDVRHPPYLTTSFPVQPQATLQ